MWGQPLTGCCPNVHIVYHLWVMMPFLKCLVGGLRHFMVLRNGGPPGSRSSERENREGGGITRP
jgi:hypothetical protein